MNFSKRFVDVTLAMMLLILLSPVMVALALAILLRDGRPVFYVSERMKGVGRPFMLVKFRTMRPDPRDWGASGGHKVNRITKTGRFLRSTRLDEVPQLWNVLRGDMSFVGPRPPLRKYVEEFPEIYSSVLETRPGVTGLASIIFHKHEEYLLKDCTSADETEFIYTRSCIPKKAHLDLIYQSNRSICLDLLLMLKTLFRRTPIRFTR